MIALCWMVWGGIDGKIALGLAKGMRLAEEIGWEWHGNSGWRKVLVWVNGNVWDCDLLLCLFNGLALGPGFVNTV